MMRKNKRNEIIKIRRGEREKYEGEIRGEWRYKEHEGEIMVSEKQNMETE